MPKISVIVPVYNTAKYLEKCLNSIINQTYKDIEIIIVNDGSTDNSQNIIDQFKQKYPDIIRCFIKQNGGLSDARNFGIAQAEGNYLAFVDSDDYIDLELFDKLQHEMELETDLIKFKLIKVNDNYEIIEKIDGPIFARKKGEDAFNTLVFQDHLLEPTCLYLYKRDLFTKNNFYFANNKYHEDFGLTPLIIVSANMVSSQNIYGYYYLQSDNSITRNVDYNKTYKRSMDLLFHYDNMTSKVLSYDLQKETIFNLKQYYTNAILTTANYLNKDDRIKYLLEIKKRNLTRNIKCKSFKSFIKKIIMNISLKLYLKMERILNLTMN